jgi:uncharacterized membrane protein
VAAVATFVVVLSAVSELRYLALVGTTWDLGIYQQALWSAAHGGPFYEAADYETGGFGSFLQVHSAFVLYLLAPVYGAWPNPLTLFIAQALVVGLGALPLYYLALVRGASPRRSLGLAVVYLAWAPAIDGALHDFHIEAFVPLVYLTVTYLWSARRYALGAVAFVIAVSTMEVVPVLLAFVGALLVAEKVVPQWRKFFAGDWWGPLREREVLAGIALMVASLLSYYLLLELRTELLSAWFGFPAFPTTSVGYVIGGTPAGLQLAPGFLSDSFYQKLTYWIVLFALLGFIPAARLRGTLLVMPWFLFTMFTNNANYTIMGFQYGLVAAGPMFAAAAWALPFLPRVTSAAANVPSPSFSSHRQRWRIQAPSRLALAAVGLVAVNLAATPFGGLVGNMSPGLNYSIGQAPPSEADGAFALAGLVPPLAPVLASDLLFPLIANDPNAYSLLWAPDPTLIMPFNGTNLPPYFLLAEGRLGAVPPWLVATLYNSSDFGIRGVAWGTPVGTALLFQAGYNGPTSIWGSVPSMTQTITPSELTIPYVEGAEVDDAASVVGTAIITLPYAVGVIWDGPHSDLAPGIYNVTFWVRAFPTDTGVLPAPGTLVLTLEEYQFAQPNLFDESFSYGAIEGSAFTPIQMTIDLKAPTLAVAFPGEALAAAAGIELESIDVAPAIGAA